VIREAMRESNKVALGRVVIGRRERIVMIEPWKKGLLATLLRYGYEVRDDAVYFEDIPDLPITAEMRDLAEVIVQRKSGHFDPTEFEDRYENALIALMRHKQAGTPAPAPAVSRPANVVNLMDALRRSVAAEKAAEPTAPVLDAEPKPAITSKDRKARKKAETPAPDTTASAPKKPRRARRMM
jgi:DNA end-binding protein Ku